MIALSYKLGGQAAEQNGTETVVRRLSICIRGITALDFRQTFMPEREIR